MTTAMAAKPKLSISNVIEKIKRTPPRFIINGIAGIGKTSFATHFPKPIFIQSPGETGLETLINSGQLKPVPIFGFPDSTQATSWEQLLEAIHVLTVEDHSYKTLVIDVMNGLEPLCFDYVLRNEFQNNTKSFQAYGKGVDSSVNQWRRLLNAIDRLRTERDMYFVGLTHCSVRKFSNPMDEDYDRYEANFNRKIWDLTRGWSDLVLFCNTETFMDDNGKPAGKKRKIFTSHDPCYDAKHRHGLPESIDMGTSGEQAYRNLTAAMKAAKGVNNS